MGLFSRKRFVVTNLFVAVDAAAFAPTLALCQDAQKRIVEHADDFALACTELARVAGAVLDRSAHLTHAACFGEVFDDEGDAEAAGQSAFADLSTRYLAADDAGAPSEALPGERRAVVMLTIAYQGEEPALEGDLGSVIDVEDALKAVIALHHQERLLLAHVHHAPAHPEDKLTDEQLLVNYPELLSL